MDKIKVAITQGDTNGVGLEVVLKALSGEHITELFTPVVFANHNAVRHTLTMIGEENLPLNYIDAPSDASEGRINIVNVGNSPVTPVYGQGTPVSGAAAVESLVVACNSLDDEEADVLVTAPIDKGAAQVDGFNFVGHTEFLEERFGDEEHHARMLLFNDELRVMLQTTHLPISGVAPHITRERVLDSIRVFSKVLVESFEIERPRIAVLSLNPHNGDHGLLGREEIDEIIPAVEEAREEGILAFGPYAADGFFGSDNRRAFDGILAMYHDQGLAPFKTIARQSGVNHTANLSVVRTSPDHGTAFDIAGRNEADGTSMREAIYRAMDIYRARRRYEEMSLNPLKKYRETKPERSGNIE